MEIISFVGSSSAVKKNSSSLNFTFPRIAKSPPGNKVVRNDVKRPFATPVYAGNSGVNTFSQTYSKTERQFTALGISKIFSSLAYLLIFLSIPVLVFYALSYTENNVAVIDFDKKAPDELEALNAAMSRFAMYDTLSDNVDSNGNVLADDGSILEPSSIKFGEPVKFQTYTVHSGDSISTISRKFGLANISTLIAVNDIANVRTLRSGQKLKIPSADGLIHKVKTGETLNALSVKYHVSVEEILDANDLASETLVMGADLFIPGAKMDASSLKKAMGELFVYPIAASWRLTSRFGPRKDPFTGVASNHTGIDMACPTGTPIRAAMSGTVVFVGWSNIFGNYVIINHGNGYQTLYGHMSKVLAKKGQSVDQSTRIGLVGSTGYSTGPHLHFTVYKNGKLVDPLTLLKR
ncbi:MAG: M23 family metallopeptidase [Treponema sp.]|nr:M23 family metallopeptidase [Treponema sp.]